MEGSSRRGEQILGHPYRSAVFFWILFFLLNVAGGIIGFPLLGVPALLVTLASLITAGGGLFMVWYLGWWQKAGYATLGRVADLPLFLLPAAMAFLPLLEVAEPTPGGTVILFILLSIVVALAEETFFRGLILQALRPAGVMTAVILSSLLFALPHLLNSVGGIWDPVFTLADTFAAFGIGIAFAALVLRTGSIWPPIVLHALINAIALSSLGSLTVPPQSPEQLAGTLVAGAVMAAYGLFLLRRVPQSVTVTSSDDS
jgi:membrane protease YdiL (CAAX protease family)